MLTLLPQEEKTRHIHEYYVRLTIVILFFVATLLVSALVGLLPSYVNERADLNALKEAQQQAELESTNKAYEESEIVKAYNAVLVDYLNARIVQVSTPASPSSVLYKILENSNSSISISELEMTHQTVIVRGVASTREGLIAFHNTLRSHLDFKNATLPISDLAKSSNANFTIQIPL